MSALGLSLVAGACSGGSASMGLRVDASRVAALARIREDPDRYRGDTVVLGGEILGVENKRGETVLTVLDEPLDRDRRPVESDATEGRLLARVGRYLDPLIFAPGRAVTLTGTVLGVEARPVGQVPYSYVVVRVDTIHLWQAPVYPYPAPYGPVAVPPWWGLPHPPGNALEEGEELERREERQRRELEEREHRQLEQQQERQREELERQREHRGEEEGEERGR